jgi:hypothetical protein
MKRWAGGMLVMVGLLLNFSVSGQPVAGPFTVRLLNSPQSVDVGATDLRGRCLNSAFESPGQAWRQGLSAGGVTQRPVKSIDPAARGQLLAGGLLPTAEQTVTVLIVDHFGPVPITIIEGGVTTQYQLSHGNLVTEHLRAVLTGAGFVQRDRDLFQKGKGRIQVVTVETDGLRTDQVASKLKLAMEGKDLMVVNMSLALLPCEIDADYQAGKKRLESERRELYTLNHYLTDLYANNPQYRDLKLVDFERQLLNPPDLNPQEPLRAFVTGLHSIFPHAVMVASSGNYGLLFSTMPAAWDEVVSVGASDPQGRRAITSRLPAAPPNPAIPAVAWPDRGDVMEVGQWLQLAPDTLRASCKASQAHCALQGLPLTSPIFDRFRYRGTSFSAPTVSAYVAMAMLMDEPRCVPPRASLPPNGFTAAWPKLPIKEPTLKARITALSCP